ncbi:MAG TPA: hypothetical protein PKD10_06230 [Paracoccaceae bacterium]|nr:hypothetical protein [Paracoccaceae bacterium]HMO71913.1 hypothetical protein [Paracoccaceae bacterium]
MRLPFLAVLLAVVIALPGRPAGAQGWFEPPRGSAERRALMDAVRPMAEQLFGPPVEFMVHRLRVSGDLAFASVGAQRPGGGQIDVRRTPGWVQGYFMEDAHHTGGQAILVRRGGQWVVVDIVFGATDVWWVSPDYCVRYRAVIGDDCR